MSDEGTRISSDGDEIVRLQAIRIRHLQVALEARVAALTVEGARLRARVAEQGAQLAAWAHERHAREWHADGHNAAHCPMTVVVYYDAGRGFSEKDAVRVPLHQSREPLTYHFELPGAFLARPLRLDVGNALGTYAVHAVRLLSEESTGRRILIYETTDVAAIAELQGDARYSSGSRLTIAAVGEDPQMILRPVVDRIRGTAHLEIDLTFEARIDPSAITDSDAPRVTGRRPAPAQGWNVCVYWDSGGGMSERRTSRVPLVPSATPRTYAIEIPAAALAQRLRIDVGNCPGRYLVRSIAIGQRGEANSLLTLGGDELRKACTVEGTASLLEWPQAVAIDSPGDDPQLWLAADVTQGLCVQGPVAVVRLEMEFIPTAG